MEESYNDRVSGVCLSLSLSVCLSVDAILLPGKWPVPHQTQQWSQVCLHPDCAQGQKVTRYGHLCVFKNSYYTGKWPVT